MSLSIKSSGAFAYMGIIASIERERAEAQAMGRFFSELEQRMFADLYAKRYASTCISERNLTRQDIMDRSTVAIYASPRAYRKTALSTGQRAH